MVTHENTINKGYFMLQKINVVRMEEKFRHVLQLADVTPSQMQEFASPFRTVGPCRNLISNWMKELKDNGSVNENLPSVRHRIGEGTGKCRRHSKRVY
jgi:hypothetical protein